MNRWVKRTALLLLVLSLFVPGSFYLGGWQYNSVTEVRAVAYSYLNDTPGNVNDGGCGSWPLTRYFLVNDDFTVNDLNVEYSQYHANRGQIRLTLTAPDGTERELISTSTNTENNFYITLDDDGTGGIYDGTGDTIGGTRRSVDQNLLTDFEGLESRGAWVMVICDNTDNSGTHEAYDEATLVFDGTPITPTPLNHTQGPAMVETYYLPWPEDDVRTIFDRTFDSTCANYDYWRDDLDAAPREPTVSYTGITIIDAGTIITYDHWEDGYEGNLTYPSQNTTEVWGDGDLSNGAAPDDADDVFVNGQVLILDDIMLSTTLGSVIDFDARDKLGASNPINVSRSVWSAGSATLFAAADEVYPVSDWGTQFYSPVGDDANLYNMFDISVVSIIAAYDGTLVDIDKDGDGTYETTGVALDEGDRYYIDDNTDGMDHGGGIRSNADHPIQVNLMTSDRCAGYESRTYPLLPYEQWDSSYYLPVSTITTATGPGGDEAPTTVHIFNPNTTSITVNYDNDSGSAGSLTVPAGSNNYVVVSAGDAYHFYTDSTTPTDNVRDEFGIVAYSNNDGSQNWSNNWDETGDDDSASDGSILVADGVLRINGGSEGSGNFRDEFTTAVYNRNDGSLNWTADWTEVGDGTGGATSGTIYINTDQDELRFRENSTGGDAIYRTANLSGFSTAAFSFELDGVGVDTTDDIAVEVSGNGGTTWTQLGQFESTNDPNGTTTTYDISAYISSNTTIRFIMINTLETDTGDGERWDIDDVDIAVTGGTGTTYDTTSDTIEREVDLSGAVSSTLTFDLTSSGTLDAGDSLRVEVSDDGGGTWTTLATYTDDTTTSASFDISAYIASNTRVRFTQVNDLDVGEYWNIDNVDITSEGTPDYPNFYAVASVDSETDGTTTGTENSTYDWGITMVPESVMSQWVIVGWAPGDDPTSDATPENTAPIWLTGGHPTGSSTPSATFDICVDYNGDCTSGTCTLDTITGRYYDRQVTGISPLTQMKIYNGVVNPPDAATQGTAGDDQTGTSIWICGPTGTDALLTAAWGEDPLVADPSKPGVDLGYTVRNQRSWRAAKSAELQVDRNGNGLYDVGDTIRYTLTFYNTGTSSIPTMNVKDTNDTNVTYVAGSTYLTNDGTAPPSSGQIADSPSAGDFPLDSSGSGYDYTDFDPGTTFSIQYDVTIDLTDPFVETRRNVTIAQVEDDTFTTEVTVTVRDSDELGSIGNYVWLDEDGDGDQDAGESGIPNVLVTLTNGVDTYTTYTDADGGYLFTDLPADTWTVTVSPPAALHQTYDEDGIGTPDVTIVDLYAGEEHLTADFGYNWSSPTDTNDPPGTGALGAIGDRVWVDVDGEGDQDPEEVGIQGIEVQLWYDSDGDGVIDAQYGPSETTDANGNYLFDDLPAGTYEVRVIDPPWTQTGDPDGTFDDQTGVVLAPGDVFLNADFGYRPDSTDDYGEIGDTVWFDADADGIYDPPNGYTEYGLVGVTVSLIQDTNGNGTWDAGEPIIATDITDESGEYLFTGLPAGDGEDYLVWVNDTEDVLDDLIPTYDDDDQTPPITTPNISWVSNLTPAGNYDQDFGYTAPDHDPGDGLIGDTVFLDLDGDGFWDPDEGMEGVLVRLYASDGVTLLAETTTNEDGLYYFGDLLADADGETYIVQVQTGTLPYPGLSNTVDPDGGFDSYSTVTLTTGSPIDLHQDFGYRATEDPNTIGGTLWEDTNADGTLPTLPDEPGRFEGVTVVLRDPNGDIIATTVTDANGDYSFTGLPDGTYTVDVTDDVNILNGYWHSDGPNDGLDNNSQDEPYSVSVSGGETNTTGDFGYYIEPAGVGNYVWEDTNDNGVQESGEPGVENVAVTLTIDYPNGEQVVMQTTTDSTGYYSFDNLLLDEDFNSSDGTGGSEPVYTLTADIPVGYSIATNDAGSDDLDSDGVLTGGDSEVVIGPSPNSPLIMGGYNPDYDFGLLRSPDLGSIGNYVWLDEDGDGDQDAGEAGIPNVEVTLTNGTETYTTYTDADGGYLFTDLPADDWTVIVSPPAGLHQTFDEDGIGTPDTSDLTLAEGEEHLSADFGYNWSSPTDTNDPPPTGALGAIGDRVWVDVDGQGDQDPEEVGIEGLEVQLWYDSDGDGVIDAQYGPSDTTDANGNYLFDDLPPGTYEVRIPNPPPGWAQTGDPDGTFDDQTGVVLAPGDVFLNADFGYQPPSEDDYGFIGDTVWLDADADGVYDTVDPAEYGIAGVTVALIKDDGDGVYEPGVDPIIATTVTGDNPSTTGVVESGWYQFTGLPAGDGEDYLVWVNDTEDVLDDLVPTYDDDGIVTPNISRVDNLTSTGNLDQDFGYTPPEHDPGEGLIGDTIFLDVDADGVPDPNEGIEGVVVELYASDGVTKLAETTTNEDGLYFFGDLPVDTTYIVQVQTSTLPGTGLTNTVDPDGGNDSTSTVTLTTAAPIDLDQDFGYRDLDDPNTIGGTVWEDTNADGTLPPLPDEPGRFEGVTVVLRDPSGNIVATTVTDANGDYLFTNLPDDTYTVDVTDDANILNGYWHSDGPNDGLDNNSQDDPYTVTVSGGQIDTTGDFGYYKEPAGVGNLLWHDVDSNGVQDPGEPGLPGLTVTLTITYPNGTVVDVVTTTDEDGYYRFDNLMLDEDFNSSDGTGGSEPIYDLTMTIPAEFFLSTSDAGGNDALDSDGIFNAGNAEVTVGLAPNSALLMGGFNPDYDFGMDNEPTALYPVTNFKADYSQAGVRLSWDSSDTTIDNFSFEVLDDPNWIEIGMVEKEFNVFHYEFIDHSVQPGVEYTYRMMISFNFAGKRYFDTVTITGPYNMFVPMGMH